MDARGRLAKFTIQEHVTCVKGESWHGGRGTKKVLTDKLYFVLVLSDTKVT